jgi:hypothetical protein
LCAGDMRLSLTGRRLALPVPGRVYGRPSVLNIEGTAS